MRGNWHGRQPLSWPTPCPPRSCLRLPWVTLPTSCTQLWAHSPVAFSVPSLHLIHGLSQARKGGRAGLMLGWGALGLLLLDPLLTLFPPATWTSHVLRPSTASSCTASPWLGMARARICTHSMALASCPKALQGEGMASVSWQWRRLRPTMERALLGISTVFCYFPTVDLVYFLPSSGDSSPVGALKCRDEGPQMGLAWLLAGVRWHEDCACGLETSSRILQSHSFCSQGRFPEEPPSH